MNRVEIIANNALEENLMGLLEKKGIGQYYTRFNNVHGRGFTNPKMGSAVWPEEDFVIVIYCEDEKAQTVKEAVKTLRKAHPAAGIQVFSIPFQHIE